MAIQCVKENLAKMKTMQGSRVSVKTEDKHGKPVTQDFDLLSMVTTLEKLYKMGIGSTEENISYRKAQEILGGVKSAID